jgi:hypothetical protein
LGAFRIAGFHFALTRRFPFSCVASLLVTNDAVLCRDLPIHGIRFPEDLNIVFVVAAAQELIDSFETLKTGWSANMLSHPAQLPWAR